MVSITFAVSLVGKFSRYYVKKKFKSLSEPIGYCYLFSEINMKIDVA